MTGENRQQSSPFPAPDPLGVVEVATGGAVRDPLRVAADNMAELDREAVRAATKRERQDRRTKQPEQQSEQNPEPKNQEVGRETVLTTTGEQVHTIL